MESQQQGKYCLQKCIAVVLNMLGLFQATPTKDGGSLNPVRDLETRNAKGVETLQVEIEAGVASTSSLGHVRAGCGRHGLRRKRPGHVIKTAVHRFPITAVEAFWQQAKDQVTKTKRTKGRHGHRGRAQPNDDGRMSPSAKAFAMFSPKTFTPTPPRVPNSSKRTPSGKGGGGGGKGKQKSKRDDVSDDVTVDDLEVKIVPKFPTDGNASRAAFRRSSSSTSRNQATTAADASDDDDESVDSLGGRDVTRKRRPRGRPRKSFPILDPEKSEETDDTESNASFKVTSAASSSNGKKVTIVETRDGAKPEVKDSPPLEDADAPEVNKSLAAKTDTGG